MEREGKESGGPAEQASAGGEASAGGGDLRRAAMIQRHRARRTIQRKAEDGEKPAETGEDTRDSEIANDPDFLEACQKADAGELEPHDHDHAEGEGEKDAGGGDESVPRLKVGGDKGDQKNDGKKDEELTGIGAKVAVDRFVTKAKSVQASWKELGGAQPRADAMGGAANEELEAAGVPGTGVGVVDLDKRLHGKFVDKDWKIEFNEKHFKEGEIKDDEAAELADTTYHEARHAEQAHLMARLQTQKGTPPEEVAKNLTIPPRVAVDAKSKPIEGAEQKLAEKLVAAGTGKKNKQREKQIYENVQNKLGTARKLKDKWEALKKDKSTTKEVLDQAWAEYLPAFREFKKAYAEYQSLVAEADADKVGGAVGRAYKKATPAP